MKFYFDYISPNAYLAWTQIQHLMSGRDIVVEPIAVLFSGLLNAHGQRGPAEIPAKMHWMVRDILWKAERLGVPLNPPASHPFNPLLALRVSCLPLPAQRKTALITAIFSAVWVQGMDVSDPVALVEVLNQADFDGETLVTQASLPETKNLLRQQTSDAIQAGVFGVPSMLVNDRLFWGFDDFAHLEAVLDGKTLTATDTQAWDNLTASAVRKNVQ